MKLTANGTWARGAAAAAGLLLLVALVRTAWVCDDAYITFRVADNLVHGFGPTWNVAERVQAFTNPLWMFLVAAGQALTGAVYHAALLLSLLCTVAAAVLLVRGTSRSMAGAALAILALACSRAFTDYSTSGLENPLTHLLLVAVFAVYLRRDQHRPRDVLLIWSLASLCCVNRLDSALLVAPVLGLVLLRERSWRHLGAALAGLVPLACWLLFALLYYGFALPNTAYAKLTTCLPRAELLNHGAHYLQQSLRADPVTAVTLGLGLVLPVVLGRWRCLPLVAGAVLYLAYVVYIGGDFMRGRFLAAPLLCCAVALSRCLPAPPRVALPALAALILAAVLSPQVPALSSADHGPSPGQDLGFAGVADERAFYYELTGLLRQQGAGQQPDNLWVAEGIAARRQQMPLAIRDNLGLFGYHAGPRVHVLDEFGLADPLLARLCPRAGERWRAGHQPRSISADYRRTLERSQVAMGDANLARYLNQLWLVTRGELWSGARLAAIWRLNTGDLDRLLPGRR